MTTWIELRTLDPDLVDRAERIQLIFSRRYEENWRAQFGLRSEAGRSA